MSENGYADVTGGDEVTATSDEQGNKTFTQDEVDKLVKDRLARQSKKYADYEELKSFKSQSEQERLASLSETEKAIETARTETASKIRTEYAVQLAAAQVKAELTGLVDNPDAVVEDLNISKFINEDYSVNTDAIKALRAKYEGLIGNRKTNHSIQHGRSSAPKAGGTPKDDFADLMNNIL